MRLANVNPGGAQRKDSLHLGGLVAWSKADVQAILRSLRLRDAQEQQVRCDTVLTRVRRKFESTLVGVGVRLTPAEVLFSGIGEPRRVVRVDADTLET